VVCGLAIAVTATVLNPQSYLWLTAGISLYGFGAGLVSAGLYRMTLFSSSAGKGSVAAMLGMVSILIIALGIEAAKTAYFSYGTGGFSVVNLICGLLWLVLVSAFLRADQRKLCTE
jgi:DHA1 family multidrug/chloramphenicol efflux transport protein-like MFS transporter